MRINDAMDVKDSEFMGSDGNATNALITTYAQIVTCRPHTRSNIHLNDI